MARGVAAIEGPVPVLTRLLATVEALEAAETRWADHYADLLITATNLEAERDALMKEVLGLRKELETARTPLEAQLAALREVLAAQDKCGGWNGHDWANSERPGECARCHITQEQCIAISEVLASTAEAAAKRDAELVAKARREALEEVCRKILQAMPDVRSESARSALTEALLLATPTRAPEEPKR